MSLIACFWRATLIVTLDIWFKAHLQKYSHLLLSVFCGSICLFIRSSEKINELFEVIHQPMGLETRLEGYIQCIPILIFSK